MISVFSMDLFKIFETKRKSSLCWMKPISWLCWKISGFYIVLKNGYSFSWLLLVLKYRGKIIAYFFRYITYANAIQNNFFHQVSMDTDFLSLITLTHFIFPLRTLFFKENVCKFFFRVSKRNPRKDCKVVDETFHPAGKESLMCNIPKWSDTLSVFQKMLQDL